MVGQRGSIPWFCENERLRSADVSRAVSGWPRRHPHSAPILNLATVLATTLAPCFTVTVQMANSAAPFFGQNTSTATVSILGSLELTKHDAFCPSVASTRGAEKFSFPASRFVSLRVYSWLPCLGNRQTSAAGKLRLAMATSNRFIGTYKPRCTRSASASTAIVSVQACTAARSGNCRGGSVLCLSSARKRS